MEILIAITVTILICFSSVLLYLILKIRKNILYILSAGIITAEIVDAIKDHILPKVERDMKMLATSIDYLLEEEKKRKINDKGT